MTKLSKTAQAAMNAVERGNQKVKVELTFEEKLRQIRLNLEAGLSIPPQYIRLLLEKYDELAARLAAIDSDTESMKREVEEALSAVIAQAEGPMGLENLNERLIEEVQRADMIAEGGIDPSAL